MSNPRRQFEAGEVSCSVCSTPLPAFVSNIRNSYVCSNPSCKAQHREGCERPNYFRRVEDEQFICSRPGCGKFVPAGLYRKPAVRLFCTPYCDHLFYAQRIAIEVGICIDCGNPIYGMPHELGKRKFDKKECRLHYLKVTRVVELTGQFAPVLLDYFESEGKQRYGPTTYPGMRCNLIQFGSYLVERNISNFADVTSRIITDYIAFQRSLRKKADTYLSQINVFYFWLQAFVNVAIRNPVIPYIHVARTQGCNPRPYSESQMEFLWQGLEADRLLQLRLAFAIGEECGLRIGEVANVRLPDIDLIAQQIYVRLPTKNGRPRTVPFDEKVLKYLNLWLAVRDPRCAHDNLLHNSQFRRYSSTTLSQVFYKRFGKFTAGRVKFSFHALRHTWCSRLLNAGIEPAVLMELGGWGSWAAMQNYVKLLQSTIDRSYAAAALRMHEQRELEPETTMSLVEFAETQSGTV